MTVDTLDDFLNEIITGAVNNLIDEAAAAVSSTKLSQKLRNVILRLLNLWL